jgi:glycosyltransferase involved in cell wall biosynthesis
MKPGKWHICVLIPARNEEELLPRCLYSLLNAVHQLPKNCTVEIVLAVDSSTDNTSKIGREILHGIGSVIEIDHQGVGYARLKAGETALTNYTAALDRCWLANTDADCEIPADWLIHQLRLAKEGTHAVAGIVDVDSFEEHDCGVPQRFRETYIIHEDGSHPHIHGANLGVRADSYILAGGWSDLKTAEDHDLWNRMKAMQFSMKSDATLRVITSGRRKGRAPDSFAKALSSHNRIKNESY